MMRTPEHILALANICMGGIDLVPNSEDDLDRPWQGRVFVNATHGREISVWVDKLCEEYEAGRVSGAVALVLGRPGSQWWKRLSDYPVCFIRGRLRLPGHHSGAPFPSAVFYLGDDVNSFCRAFNVLGDVWRRWEPEAPIFAF